MHCSGFYTDRRMIPTAPNRLHAHQEVITFITLLVPLIHIFLLNRCPCPFGWWLVEARVTGGLPFTLPTRWFCWWLLEAGGLPTRWSCWWLLEAGVTRGLPFTVELSSPSSSSSSIHISGLKYIPLDIHVLPRAIASAYGRASSM